MKEAPSIKATGDEPLKKIRRTAPYYIPDWDANQERGSGAALLRIFAGMMNTVAHRLNRAPEKHFVAFLDKLGIKQLPSQPARVPVTFILSTGAKENVTIPERTQVAAGAVAFEIEKTFTATPAKLAKAYSVSGDAIFEAPSNIVTGKPPAPFSSALLYKVKGSDNELFLENAKGLNPGDIVIIGQEEVYAVVAEIKDAKVLLTDRLGSDSPKGTPVEKITSFDLFKGKDLQEHILYLGDKDLFNIKKGQIELYLAPWDGKFAEQATWEYYGEKETGELKLTDWHPFTKQYASDGRLILEKDNPDELKEVKVSGIQSRWIRCRIKSISDFQNVAIDTIHGAAKPLGVNGLIAPDLALYNDVSLDLTTNNGNLKTPIYPLGKIPRLFDTFYIASKDAFSKKGAEVKLKIDSSIDLGGDTVTAKPTISALLAWEYWNGNGWVYLPVDSADFKFDVNKELIIKQLPEIIPTKVNGQENYWIRVRLVQGHYGQEMVVSGNTVAAGKVTPPKMTSLKIVYTPASQSLDQCLTYSGLNYTDLSDESKSPNKKFKPFQPLEDEHPSLYLGYDKKLEKGPISLFLHIEEPLFLEAPARIEWQYYAELNGTYQWQRLEGLDSTQGFARSGTVALVFPENFVKRKLFGQELYWIRAVDILDNLDHPQIKGIYLNTAWAVQMATIRDEILGASTAEAGQQFFFSKTPALQAEVWVNELGSLSEGERKTMTAGTELLPVEVKDAKGNTTEFWVPWSAMPDLLSSAKEDRHFEFDPAAGYIRFGDGISGKIPPIGKKNIKTTYRTGGGTIGNVGAGEVSALKSAIAFVDKVLSPIPAGGGSEKEAVEDILDRGSHSLRNRNRAVSEEDYEYLAKEASTGIARVKCIPNLNRNLKPEPGWVSVIIVPSVQEKRPQPGLQLKTQVETYLQSHGASTGRIHIGGPSYLEVTVEPVIVSGSMEDLPMIEKEAFLKLKQFLHPLEGGYEGTGWEFGRLPFYSDFYSILEKIKGVDYVESLTVTLKEIDSQNEYELTPAGGGIPIHPWHMIYSGTHKITVSYRGRV